MKEVKDNNNKDVSKSMEKDKDTKKPVDVNALKSKSTVELEETLETLLTYTDHEQDVYVKMILLELLKRGIDKEDIGSEKIKEKVEKAFEVLQIVDSIQKLNKS